jgi:hypothetical protein
VLLPKRQLYQLLVLLFFQLNGLVEYLGQLRLAHVEQDDVTDNLTQAFIQSHVVLLQQEDGASQMPHFGYDFLQGLHNVWLLQLGLEVVDDEKTELLFVAILLQFLVHPE